MLACFIVQKQYVLLLHNSCAMSGMLTLVQLQANARHRNSITTGAHQLSRHRTDSFSNRKRSDSNRTEKPLDDEVDNLRHPVESRTLTALLPPIMVCFTSLASIDRMLTIIQSKEVGSDPISWLGFQEDFIFTSSLEGSHPHLLPPLEKPHHTNRKRRPHPHLDPTTRRRHKRVSRRSFIDHVGDWFWRYSRTQLNLSNPFFFSCFGRK